MSDSRNFRVHDVTALLVCAAGLLVGGLPALANPEGAAVQSALVWRSDGTGDYPLPPLGSDNTYQLTEAIPTAGQIDTLTAVWASEGTVTLELSADGGLHYAPAVNGVPLMSGLVGNRLKWRATLGPDSRLADVTIVYTDRAGTVGTFGEPKLSGFTFRKPIAVTGSPSGDLFAYQMLFVIGGSSKAPASDAHCEGRARSDFADLRFTAADGRTILPHYLEEIVGSGEGRAATVWVKIPQIPSAGVTIYLYYGNPSAPNLSDGQAVFEFFDDFRGGILDAARWHVGAGEAGSAEVADAGLHLTAASIFSETFQMTDGVAEYLATTTTGQDDARLIIRSDRAASHPDDTNQVAYASAYAGAEHALAVGNVVKANDPNAVAGGAAFGYRVIARGTALAFERFDPKSLEVLASTAYDDAGGLTRGALGLHSEGAAAYAWVRVRKDARPEPAVAETMQAPEERVEPPTFLNTTVGPNGDVAPANPKLEGLYETGGMGIAFPARILVPQWKGQVASVAFSADGGASYHEEGFPGAHYYASKGDFIPGRRLKTRVAMKVTDNTPAPKLQAVSLDYAPGTVFVVSPNGGERVAVGAAQEVAWTAQGHERTYPMRLEYSLDGGATYHLITDSTDNDGSFVWVLPEGVSAGQALVRVSDGFAPKLSDVSDAVFSIGLPGAAPAPQAAASSSDAPAAAAPLSTTEADTATSGLTEDLAELLDQLSTDPNAVPHELLIEVTGSSDPDPDKDALSYKAGDIVMIKPAGAQWSETEKNSFLILQANLTPEAAITLMGPLEAPTGATDKQGKPVMRVMGRRKFKVDVSFFDLQPKPGDKGKPAVLRHFKERQSLGVILEEKLHSTQSAPALSVNGKP